jgi:hypothetical protein
MMAEAFDHNVFTVCANTGVAALMDRSLPLVGMRYIYRGYPSRCTSLTAIALQDGVFRIDASFATDEPSDEWLAEHAMRWQR